MRRTLRSPIAPLLAITAVDMLGFGLILPLLPYYAQTFGADPLTIGFLAATYSVAQFVGTPIIGRLSDVFGRKPILILTQLVQVSGFVMLALADSLFMIFLARIIAGLMGANIPVAQAALADLTEPEDRSRAFGLFGAANGLGFIMGPAIGGLLAVFGYAVPAWAAAGMGLFAAFLALTLLPHRPPARTADGGRPGLSREGLRATFSKASVVRLLVMFMLSTLAFSVFQSNIVLFLDLDFGFLPSQAGLLLAYGGLLVIVCQLFILPRVVPRWGERLVVTGGLTSLSVGLFLTAATPVWWPLLATFVFIVIGGAIVKPCLDGMVSGVTPESERGAVFGVTNSLDALMRMVAPIAGGWALGTFGGSGMTLMAALLAALAALLAMIVLRGVPEPGRRPRNDERGEASRPAPPPAGPTPEPGPA